MTELVFDDAGLLAAHIDYFDGADVILQRQPEKGEQVASIRADFHV